MMYNQSGNYQRCVGFILLEVDVEKCNRLAV